MKVSALIRFGWRKYTAVIKLTTNFAITIKWLGCRCFGVIKLKSFFVIYFQFLYCFALSKCSPYVPAYSCSAGSRSFSSAALTLSIVCLVLASTVVLYGGNWRPRGFSQEILKLIKLMYIGRRKLRSPTVCRSWIQVACKWIRECYRDIP